jgi:glutamate/tyrosine decarboxylase-like PLP-dependent enzyme
MVSGGNMANPARFLARAPGRTDVRQLGITGASARRLRVYGSAETHTWIQKAADLSGLGTSSIRWIPTGSDLRMDVDTLRRTMDADMAAGDLPCIVVGTAGSVSTGAVDDLPAIAVACRERGAWFHVDGAYGGFAAASPDAPADLIALRDADSVAVDPHKWLYAPLGGRMRAGARPRAAARGVRLSSPYYHFEERATNYVDYGPQNSRGFRALKVWLALRQVGAAGYRAMIADDMRLARALADAVRGTPELDS